MCWATVTSYSALPRHAPELDLYLKLGYGAKRWPVLVGGAKGSQKLTLQGSIRSKNHRSVIKLFECTVGHRVVTLDIENLTADSDKNQQENH
jgi:hypothetical protein